MLLGSPKAQPTHTHTHTHTPTQTAVGYLVGREAKDADGFGAAVGEQVVAHGEEQPGTNGHTKTR